MRLWPSVPQASSGQLTHGRCLRIRLAPVLGGLKTSEAGSALPISGYHASYALRPIRCAACGGGPTRPAVLTIVPHVSLGGLDSSRSQSPCRIYFPLAVALYPRSPNPTAELGYDSLLRNPSLIGPIGAQSCRRGRSRCPRDRSKFSPHFASAGS